MITALILAAGQARHMGQPKMLLPWGETTVLGQVIETVQHAGVNDILVVTGGARRQVERIVAGYGGRFVETRARLVVPSYRMRRGHPWLAARPLWDEILQMNPQQTPRDFLNRHASEIEYVNVDTPSILSDLDTLEDYLKSRP